MQAIRNVKGTVFGILAALSVALMWGSVFAAPVKVTVWNSFPDRLIYKEHQQAAKEFNAMHPDIEVEVVGVPGGRNPDKLIPAIAAGTAPDVIRTSYYLAPGYAAQGVTLDITPYLRRDGLIEDIKSDILPGAQVGMWWRGKAYAIATTIGGGIVYYNPDVFDQSGLQAPEFGWDWNEFEADARKARRTDSDGSVQVNGILPTGAFSSVFPFLVQSGARFFDDTFHTSLVGKDTHVRDGMEFVAGLVDDGLWATDVSRGDAATEFKNNRSAFYLDVPRPPAIGGDQLGIWTTTRVAPAMKKPGDTPATYAHWIGWSVIPSGDSKREAAAYEFVKYMTSRKKLLDGIADHGLTTDLPARRSVLQDPAMENVLKNDPNFMTLATEVLPYGRTDGMFGSPVHASWWSGALLPLLGEVSSADRRPIPEIIADMDRTTQNLLDEFWANHQQ